MKKYLGYGVAFFFIYLLFVVAMLPASWVLSQVTLPNTVKVQGISGTLWQAKVKTLSINNQVINDLRLSTNVSSLLFFNPSVDIEFGSALAAGPEGSFTVNNLLGNIQIEDANIIMSANSISQQLTLPIELRAIGTVHAVIDNFTVGNPVCEQSIGDITWNKASVTAMEQTVSLGKLAATLDCQEGQLVMTIKPDNDLGLTFAAYIGQGYKLTGQGYIKPGAKFPQALKELLPFIARKDNQGRYAIRL